MIRNTLPALALAALAVSAAAQNPPVLTDLDTITSFGKSLVDPGQYALPFELASLLLTGAMIGAIVIAREDTVL